MSDSNFMADPVLLFSSRWASSPSLHGIHLLPKAILNLGICFYFSKKCQRGRNHFISSLLTIAPGYCFVCLALRYQCISLWFLVPYFVVYYFCFSLQFLPSDLASDSLIHISTAWFLSPWFCFDYEILGTPSLP